MNGQKGKIYAHHLYSVYTAKRWGWQSECEANNCNENRSQHGEQSQNMLNQESVVNPKFSFSYLCGRSIPTPGNELLSYRGNVTLRSIPFAVIRNVYSLVCMRYLQKSPPVCVALPGSSLCPCRHWLALFKGPWILLPALPSGQALPSQEIHSGTALLSLQPPRASATPCPHPPSCIQFSAPAALCDPVSRAGNKL